MRVRYTALPLACLVLAVGCSSETPTRAGSHQVAAPKPTKQVLGLVLPFDKYQLTQQDSYAAAKARDFLIRECMEKRGHEWSILRYPSHVDEIKNRRRYGVIEIQVARGFGYHANSEILSGGSDVLQQRNERDKHLGGDGMRAAYNEGTGCGYKANDVLDRDRASADYHLFNRLSSELLARAKKDSKVTTVTRQWARCVRESGYTYKTPDEAIGDSRWWKKESNSASPAEKSVAVADVRCKSRVGLVGALFAAESRLQKQAIKQHGAYFGRLSEARARYLDHVHAVIKEMDAP